MYSPRDLRSVSLKVLGNSTGGLSGTFATNFGIAVGLSGKSGNVSWAPLYLNIANSLQVEHSYSSLWSNMEKKTNTSQLLIYIVALIALTIFRLRIFLFYISIREILLERNIMR